MSTVQARIAPTLGGRHPGRHPAPRIRHRCTENPCSADHLRIGTFPRGPYCGAIGYVDADTGHAQLAVGIRTFFTRHDPQGRRYLHFGTGAGITYASDPAAEWAETELKAARLIALSENES